MKITTHTKNYRVSLKLENILAKKLSKIEKYFDAGAECVIRCTCIGKTEKLEITIIQGGKQFRAESADGNMFANIDRAVAKLERQIIKHKEKLRSVLAKESFEDKTLAYHARTPKILTTEILRQKTFSIEPLSEDEAELALDTSDHSFWIYANKKNGKVNVMYRRKDGHVGIIEVENSRVFSE